MSKFGWSLPPGVSTRDLPGNEDETCAVCFKQPDDCVCDECKVCFEFGNPRCHKEHGMKLNKAQLVARHEYLLHRAEAKVKETKTELEYIKKTDNPFNREDGEDRGEPPYVFSDKLEDQPDPFDIKLVWG